jgi:hypothetical protein
MFSRCGRETSNQYKCFAEPDPNEIKQSQLNTGVITRQTKVSKEDIDFVLEKLKVRF